MDFNTVLQILDSAVRLMTPLLLACLAGLYSERSGVFDIGLEGKMLMAAFTAASVAYATGSAWLGLLAGIGGSMAMSLIHGLASITFMGNQLISGVAINFLASGMTVLLGQKIFGLGGRTPSLQGAARFQEITLPLADTLGQVPVIGPIYAQLISGHSILVYVAFLAVPLTWWVLFRTRFGLRLRAVGENPASVDTAGVSVTRLRYAAIGICGVLTGIAGAYLATSLSAGFVKEMTAGRGFIALAALIFAKWRPWGALGATFLFGLLEAIANRYPNLDLGIVTVPSMFMNALPYILTVIILAGFVGRAIPPRAGGEPYVKER
ncbi:MAG: ABC transporter permease [Paracoccus sp. (in: a-proteobacteria)]|uniref:ABC transporter permease n=1 Tax=unclassified Paracoccus (in: a-proteobacteria) TaxID=2688777 RepID=UPI000C3DDA33|nr:MULTISPECIES: ABC transporter permease [unclassified Paracoccus (in: a-proteobacteria)]MAN56605.1 sugar ABC transporter permease [Paracoccus sp. (in: a-proteobacteria)]MBA49311.1 sugar ABC transporter permease [Paracoccus sp. (in: a-proteobacteria)]MCS5603726.1 ABC transporter permease [Paracoccus sp. (in: a-proteobacteria)]|tara:strand:- start:4896 stop:5861 length:966 start_codon:yes stop_codon:yes gene_type:complete